MKDNFFVGIILAIIYFMMLCTLIALFTDDTKAEIITSETEAETEVRTPSTEIESEKETEKSYSDEDLYILSHIISAEAGNCSETMMLYVGSVVLNRVADPRFPNTISEVVFQQGQYSPTWNGAYYNEPTEEAVKAAKSLLETGSIIDSSVVWQAEFRQGEGIYDILESPWGTKMYFCY